ncbi:MAG: hypothetical protein M3R25_13555 [Bacteroidota bacterium]|nr:hypothetical protein [Bacteroidota bacterium]
MTKYTRFCLYSLFTAAVLTFTACQKEELISPDMQSIDSRSPVAAQRTFFYG